MAALDGQVAIVTGTSRGIGVEIARRLLEEGASVAGCSRTEIEKPPFAVHGAEARAVHWSCDH